MKYYTVEHLPAVKRVQLQNILRSLLEEIPIEMAILYGSHARGDWVDDPENGYISDFDLLLLVQSASVATDHAFWADVQEKVRPLSGDALVHLMVRDIDEVRRQLRQGSHFFREIVEDGIVLHDPHRLTLLEDSSDSPEYAQEQTDALEQLAIDLKDADVWMKNFKNNLREGDLRHAAFELHQAVESYYKIVLAVLNGPERKIHDLSALAGACSRLAPVFRDLLPRSTREDKRRFRLLEGAYVTGRYNKGYSITQEDLKILGGHARALRESVESVCREFIARGAKDATFPGQPGQPRPETPSAQGKRAPRAS